MNGKRAVLAVEDALGEAVSRRILTSLGITVSQRLGLKGKNYLRSKARSLNQAAKGFAVFMLTDQDSPDPCPPQLIQSWLRVTPQPRFFLRIAVMEVESWIMADRRGIAHFLSIPLSRIPTDTDAIPKPKEFLVSLARLSKKTQLRADIVPNPGATSKVGPGYNNRIGEFVRTHWNIQRASAVSNSLKRTLTRLHTFQSLDS